MTLLIILMIIIMLCYTFVNIQMNHKQYKSKLTNFLFIKIKPIVYINIMTICECALAFNLTVLIWRYFH